MGMIGGDGFHQGQHICALYETADEQLAVAVAYIADGLRQRERCLYVSSSDAMLNEFALRLRESGIDVGDARQRGALMLRTSDEAHLAGGTFDSERMLRLLNDLVEEALNDGFVGLRTCGDMSWLIDAPLGSHLVVEYEAVLNQFFQNVRALGMCQYDCRRLPPALVERAAMDTHSSLVVQRRHGANPRFRAGPGAHET
jgi:hypothetical protein